MKTAKDREEFCLVHGREGYPLDLCRASMSCFPPHPFCAYVLARILAMAEQHPRLYAALASRNLIPRTAAPSDRSLGTVPDAGQGDSVQPP